MASTIHITIAGKELSQRLQKTLEEGHSVRVGRAVKLGWEVPWDLKISREHFDLRWAKGRLQVQCLEQARNPIQYCGHPMREASIAPNEWFQIGDTTFHASSVATGRPPGYDDNSCTVEFLVEENREGLEHAYSVEELRRTVARNVERQMEFLEQLPDRISASHSDSDLAGMLSQLLLDAIPNAVAVAVAHFDESKLPVDESDLTSFPKPLSMRVQTHDDFKGRFNPSRRMFLRCLRKKSSALHIFAESGGTSSVTMSEGLGWAFCTPIKAESSRGWCLYVSGQGAPQGGLVVTEDDLIGDLRFTQLVAQFIGSIRQVRMLQEQKTQLSSFFSPKVIEGLTNRDSKDLLSPAERDITVLFCDVRGFSRKAEVQRDLLTLLKSASAALSVMAGGIVERDGAIADFQGDAALGFWGWPTELQDGAAPACRSALSILRAFTQSVAQNDNLLFGFSIGMGIAHGRALAGQIGTNQQSKVGVFGPVVNQGSRLEGLTKQFGVPICIDEQTAEFARRFMPPMEGRLRRLARVRPKGMDTPITVFELLPPVHESPDVNEEIIASHEAAVDAVIRGDWRAAAESLRSIPDRDGPKKFLIQHMAEFGNKPPADWDGAFSLVSK